MAARGFFHYDGKGWRGGNGWNPFICSRISNVSNVSFHFSSFTLAFLLHFPRFFVARRPASLVSDKNFATSWRTYLALGKKRNEFLLFCARFFVTLHTYKIIFTYGNS